MANTKRHGQFETLAVGESFTIPAEEVVGTETTTNTRNAVNALRNYYRRRLPGRSFELRKQAGGTGWIITRLPDGTPPRAGRPPSVGSSPEALARQRERKARQGAAARERHAYAMTKAAASDTSPDVLAYRTKAAAQLAQLSGMARMLHSGGDGAQTTFKLERAALLEIHPDVDRAADMARAVCQRDAGDAVEVSVLRVETIVAGTPRTTLSLLLKDKVPAPVEMSQPTEEQA